MPSVVYNKLNGDLKPIKGDILVVDMERGERRTASGLYIPDDNGKDSGIHPRWCTVYRVGPLVDYVKPGQRILQSHGRWTYGIEMTLPDGTVHYVQKIDPEGILLVED